MPIDITPHVSTINWSLGQRKALPATLEKPRRPVPPLPAGYQPVPEMSVAALCPEDDVRHYTESTDDPWWER